jgi:hypothetical protein
MGILRIIPPVDSIVNALDNDGALMPGNQLSDLKSG